MKLLSKLINFVLIVIAILIAKVGIYYTGGWSTPAIIAAAMLYGIVLMAVLNMIYKALPESISKYYLNNP